MEATFLTRSICKSIWCNLRSMECYRPSIKKTRTQHVNVLPYWHLTKENNSSTHTQMKLLLANSILFVQQIQITKKKIFLICVNCIQINRTMENNFWLRIKVEYIHITLSLQLSPAPVHFWYSSNVQLPSETKWLTQEGR